jgi:hypothetical protein
MERNSDMIKFSLELLEYGCCLNDIAGRRQLFEIAAIG